MAKKIKKRSKVRSTKKRILAPKPKNARKGGNRFLQGYYQPKNVDKYIGDLDKIVYRSSWELTFMNFLDNNKNIVKWASEPFPIPYIKPTTKRVHRYYPDFYVEYADKDGEAKKELIEVKPLQQTRRCRSKNPKTKLYEDITFAINMAKWEAAKSFCDNQGITFRILTEREIFK